MSGRLGLCSWSLRPDGPAGLTVTLNGRTVIEDAELPGVPEAGPLALQHHGDPIQFADLYVKRLPRASSEH